MSVWWLLSLLLLSSSSTCGGGGFCAQASQGSGGGIAIGLLIRLDELILFRSFAGSRRVTVVAFPPDILLCSDRGGGVAVTD